MRRAHGAQLALLPAGRRPGPALRLPRPRPLRARGGPPLQPGQAADRPLREGDRGPRRRGTRPTCCPTRPTTPRTPTSSSTTRTRAEAIPKSVVVDGSFDWEGDAPPRTPVERDGHLRDPRQGLHQAPPRACATTCAGPTRAWPPRRRWTTSSASASPPSSCCPIHHIADEDFLHDRGLTQLLGLQLDRLPRAARRVRGHRAPRRAGARVQGHGQGAAPRGHRGDPRRRLQPHRRGQPPRPDAVVQGRRQRRATTGSCPTTRATTWTTRARATRSTPATPRCCG